MPSGRRSCLSAGRPGDRFALFVYQLPVSLQVRDFGDRLGDQVVSFRDKLERVERELAGMLGRISSAAQKSGMRGASLARGSGRHRWCLEPVILQIELDSDPVMKRVDTLQSPFTQH